jgi:hypothetical protein
VICSLSRAQLLRILPETGALLWAHGGAVTLARAGIEVSVIPSMRWGRALARGPLEELERALGEAPVSAWDEGRGAPSWEDRLLLHTARPSTPPAHLEPPTLGASLEERLAPYRALAAVVGARSIAIIGERVIFSPAPRSLTLKGPLVPLGSRVEVAPIRGPLASAPASALLGEESGSILIKLR